MSHTCVHICNLLFHLIWNLVQSQKNNQDNIFHWVSPSSPPTLYRALFVLLICLVHWMFVTRSAGSFVAGGAVHFMFGNAVGLVVFYSLWPGGAGNLASEVAVYSVAVVVLEVFLLWLLYISYLSVWNILLNLFLMITIPVLLYIFTNGAIWSPSIFLCLWCCGSMGGCHFLGLWFYLYGGFGVEAGGIGQFFLNSNRLPDLVPALGDGVPAQVGTFSSSGIATWCASLGRVFFLWIYCDTGSCPRWLCGYIASLGVDWGLATTHTTHLSVGMSFLLLSVAFVSYLIRGLVLCGAWSRLSLLGLRFFTQFPF